MLNCSMKPSKWSDYCYVKAGLFFFHLKHQHPLNKKKSRTNVFKPFVRINFGVLTCLKLKPNKITYSALLSLPYMSILGFL